ncbi:hypothetical protein J22TS3_36460 [Paenibacillus sp. J22TS3]|nr:hypothetical protein J22TS3_36460 [Paenibacillus sp. J22TS3]
MGNFLKMLFYNKRRTPYEKTEDIYVYYVPGMPMLGGHALFDDCGSCGARFGENIPDRD